MLFHVPDLDKALSEVKRVLKQGGIFYSATDGNGGMRPFLHEAIIQFEPESKAFTEKLPFNLQNGKEILNKYFREVERFDYENVLAITKTEDLMDWLRSTKSISGFSEENLDKLYDYFENIRIKNGAINIPRETGVFVSTK
jgi:SAM-dependent methyltransferase